jgi:hypothetical protein
MDSNDSGQSDERDQFTVPSPPPEPSGSKRPSKWASLFDECRQHPGTWRRIIEPFKSATAAQLASDIRNTWHRDPKKLRLRGLREGERWEAVSGPSPEGANPEQSFIWLRFMEGGAANDVGPSPSEWGVRPRDDIEYAW